MKHLITSAAIAVVTIFSAPALAQNSDPGRTVQTSAAGTTAKSMQADNTGPHKATTQKKAAKHASGETADTTNQNPNAPGDKSMGGH